MKLEYATVADFAQVADGKLYLIGGGWTELRCPTFPWGRNVSVAISMLIDKKDSGKEFPLSIALVDEKGAPISPEVNGKFQVRVADGTSQTRTFFALQAAIQISSAGRYTAVVASGDQKLSVSFTALFTGNRIKFQGLGDA